jgi:hypothetical protein
MVIKGGEDIEHLIRLTFRTNDAKAININVPRANPSVTGAEVRSAMERIMATQIIVTSAGTPAAIDKADLIYTEETEYVL